MKITSISATATPKGFAKYFILILNKLGLFTLDITININDDSKKGIQL